MEASVAVIGLGRVGLPLALSFADRNRYVGAYTPQWQLDRLLSDRWAAQRACQDKVPSNTGGSLADRVRQCYLPATVHRRWCSR